MRTISTGTCFTEKISNSYKEHRQAGFNNFLLDFDAFKTEEVLEGEEDIRYLCEGFVNQCKADGRDVEVAKAPSFAYELKLYPRARLEELFFQSFDVAKVLGCKAIIVNPYFVDVKNPMTDEEAKLFYDSLIPYALKSDVKILIPNQPTLYNGNIYRGILSDKYQFVEFIDSLNKKAGGEHFGMVLNTEVVNDLGQRLSELIDQWAALIDIVVMSEQDNLRDLILSLRKCEFDGGVMIDRDRIYWKVPSPLKPAYVNYTKTLMDYIDWQINLERIIRKYDSRVLFGAGNMCRVYMEIFGADYPPEFTCDNNSSIWESEAFGLQIKSPEALKELPADTAIFICNTFYDEITAQLKAMNIPNPIERFNDEIL